MESNKQQPKLLPEEQVKILTETFVNDFFEKKIEHPIDAFEVAVHGFVTIVHNLLQSQNNSAQKLLSETVQSAINNYFAGEAEFVKKDNSSTTKH